jgi:hypothetical protein
MPVANSVEDPEFARFLSRVVVISAAGGLNSPEDLLASVAKLGQEFEQLRRFRKPEILQRRFSDFVADRFRLVDVPEEYEAAGREMLTLSMLLVDHAELVVPALQDAITRLSHQLMAPGVPQIFAKLLKRAKGIAHASSDAALKIWVEDMVRGLPD